MIMRYVIWYRVYREIELNDETIGLCIIDLFNYDRNCSIERVMLRFSSILELGEIFVKL